MAKSLYGNLTLAIVQKHPYELLLTKSGNSIQ